MTEQKHPGMTNAEFDELGNYVRWVADKIGLRDWEINLKYAAAEESEEGQNPDPEVGARIKTVYGKKVANVWFSRNFRDVPPERQRVWVTHELIHCHFDLIDTLTENEFRTVVGEQFWNAWHPGFVYGVEHAVNAMAEVIGPTLPLIDWPADKE